MFEQLQSPNPDASYDLNGDGQVTDADRDTLILDVMGTTYGDANLDYMFESQDIVRVFQIGEYEDGIPGNSTWDEGDWNGDGDFDSNDLLLAAQTGGYVTAAPQAAVAALPPRRDLGLISALEADRVLSQMAVNQGRKSERQGDASATDDTSSAKVLLLVDAELDKSPHEPSLVNDAAQQAAGLDDELLELLVSDV